jgi:hypothetical protein
VTTPLDELGYLQRAIEAGARVRVCLVEELPGHLQERRTSNDDDRPTAYAHIMDPFGHLCPSLERERNSLASHRVEPGSLEAAALDSFDTR